jgi:hypothetical protein
MSQNERNTEYDEPEGSMVVVYQKVFPCTQHAKFAANETKINIRTSGIGFVWNCIHFYNSYGKKAFTPSRG